VVPCRRILPDVASLKALTEGAGAPPPWRERFGVLNGSTERRRRIMLPELLIKFILGGLIVSVFAVIGEAWKPKTFSGLFGAAPSVAITTLAMTYDTGGSGEVGVLARSMVIGAIALYAYAATCVTGIRHNRWPVWLPATAAWLVWFAVAFGGWAAAEVAGRLQ
jgi:hypothetical protein